MKIVELAKQTIEEYVKNAKIPTAPSVIDETSVQRAGVFVSIKTDDNQLRGCIGTIEPTKNTIAEEVIYNAIAAATQDPRFYPIEVKELDHLKISVDILHTPEKVNSLNELDPKNYGVIVSSDGRRGLLLPNLEGVDTVESQLEIAKMKAGISESQDINIQRFKVDRYN